MKAAVLPAIGQPLEIRDVPTPSIGPDEVLVETHTCGICRTDLHIQDGLAYVPQLPHIGGHEPAGVVAQVGQNVTRFEPGQRVVPYLFVSRKAFSYCHAGQQAQAMHLDGILGVTMDGGFAEYFKVPAKNLLAVPDNVPLETAGLVSCAVITAVHAYRKANLRVNDVAVVLGTGGIGLILIQILRAAGVRVVAVSRSQQSLELAQQHGAMLTVPLESEDAVDQIRALAGPDTDGADCVFEMVGTAETMQRAATYVRRCGKIIVIGEEQEFPAIDTIQIAQRELEIIGSRNGGIQDAVDALEMMATGIIHPPIAQRFSLEQINESLELLRSGQAHGRIVIRIKD